MSFISVAIELNNSAVDLYKSNRYEEALVLFNDAVRAVQASEEDKYHDQTHHIEKKGVICVDGEQFSQFSYSQPLQILMDETFTVNSMCAAVMYNLGLVHMKEGLLGKARKLFELSLRSLPETLYEESTEALICILIHRHLGLISYYEGMEDEAVKLLTDAYLLGIEVFGDHELVEGTANTIAQIFIRRGSMIYEENFFDEASRLFNQFLIEKARKRIFAEKNHDNVAAAA